MLKDVTDNFKKYKGNVETHKELLKKGLTQLYRGLMLLYNYALLNNTAFVKLIEKFDAIRIDTCHVDLRKDLESREFPTAVETINIRKLLEIVYADAFLNGAKPSKARKELTARRHDQRDSNMYLIGFFLGVSFVLIIVWFLSVIRK